MVRALSLVLLAGSLVGCWRGEVVRVVDGVEIRGRFISDLAYASYLRGAEWEARGRPEEALSWYRVAARRDPDSPEIWTRVAALTCALPAEDALAAADDAFERAAEIDADYEPLWRERALCAERHGNQRAALAAARRAAELDPRSEEAPLLLVELLQRFGGADGVKEAGHWLADLSLRAPDSLRLWEAVRDHAERVGDRVWEGQAAARLDALIERLGPLPADQEQPTSPWERVDAALRANALDEARGELRRSHLDGRLLAARALVLGRPALARQEAELRAGADPQEREAQIALALAAELLGEPQLALSALAALSQPSEGLLGSSRWIFAELLWRRAGAAVARSWLGADGGELADLTQLRARLLASLEPAR